MYSRKIWKLLLKKFKFSFFILFLLTFLISYLSFLIRFNLRTNLYYWEYRGKFYYLLGKFSVTEQVANGKIYVDWPKLLLILLLLYFPLKITVRFARNYFQKYYQRKVKVYLTKKLLEFAAKNKDLITQKTSEKVYVLNQIVPEFSWQFFAIPLKLFDVSVDLGLEIFSLFWLIRTGNLTEMVPLIGAFLLVNLIWLILFYFFTQKTRKLNERKRWNYQEEEKIQIKTFCENLNSPGNPVSLKKIHNSLTKNTQKTSASLILSELTKLPDLIIPGMAILFLFLYYHIWLGGTGGLDWNAYFIVYNLQRILAEVKKGFYWLSQVSEFHENYVQIENFSS
ncbi:MAG: hypothetical protein I3273_01795 [Candidatus Moeniiplasma glomeromycotorum]|nr:hypothetical protein [Candidatus Moeniiplasma glomeromycotorum]MCE8167147.1 hypothetical protein [Candidatus Moeniiplasma glomeromycotorum]MCE8168841.1 hypothetical protein [Candidatus Moeniiplasma glomeromycotorum]